MAHLPTTPAALKRAAIAAADGSARGVACGWHLVLTRPGFELPAWAVREARALAPHEKSEPLALPEWWLSGKRIRGKPNDANLAFLRRFAVALGAPDAPGRDQLVVGSWYWIWREDGERSW